MRCAKRTLVGITFLLTLGACTTQGSSPNAAVESARAYAARASSVLNLHPELNPRDVEVWKEVALSGVFPAGVRVETADGGSQEVLWVDGVAQPTQRQSLWHLEILAHDGMKACIWVPESRDGGIQVTNGNCTL